MGIEWQYPPGLPASQQKAYRKEQNDFTRLDISGRETNAARMADRQTETKNPESAHFTEVRVEAKPDVRGEKTKAAQLAAEHSFGTLLKATARKVAGWFWNFSDGSNRPRVEKQPNGAERAVPDDTRKQIKETVQAAQDQVDTATRDRTQALQSEEGKIRGQLDGLGGKLAQAQKGLDSLRRIESVVQEDPEAQKALRTALDTLRTERERVLKDLQESLQQLKQKLDDLEQKINSLQTNLPRIEEGVKTGSATENVERKELPIEQNTQGVGGETKNQAEEKTLPSQTAEAASILDARFAGKERGDRLAVFRSIVQNEEIPQIEVLIRQQQAAERTGTDEARARASQLGQEITARRGRLKDMYANMVSRGDLTPEDAVAQYTANARGRLESMRGGTRGDWLARAVADAQDIPARIKAAQTRGQTPVAQEVPMAVAENPTEDKADARTVGERQEALEETAGREGRVQGSGDELQETLDSPAPKTEKPVRVTEHPGLPKPVHDIELRDTEAIKETIGANGDFSKMSDQELYRKFSEIADTMTSLRDLPRDDVNVQQMLSEDAQALKLIRREMSRRRIDIPHRGDVADADKVPEEPAEQMTTEDIQKYQQDIALLSDGDLASEILNVLDESQKGSQKARRQVELLTTETRQRKSDQENFVWNEGIKYRQEQRYTYLPAEKISDEYRQMKEKIMAWHAALEAHNEEPAAKKTDEDRETIRRLEKQITYYDKQLRLLVDVATRRNITLEAKKSSVAADNAANIDELSAVPAEVKDDEEVIVGV